MHDRSERMAFARVCLKAIYNNCKERKQCSQERCMTKLRTDGIDVTAGHEILQNCFSESEYKKPLLNLSISLLAISYWLITTDLFKIWILE